MEKQNGDLPEFVHEKLCLLLKCFPGACRIFWAFSSHRGQNLQLCTSLKTSTELWVGYGGGTSGGVGGADGLADLNEAPIGCHWQRLCPTP
jgi:hypothetical protein